MRALAFIFLLFAMLDVVADDLPGLGSLAGQVTADEPFQAAKVYAHNADRLVT